MARANDPTFSGQNVAVLKTCQIEDCVRHAHGLKMFPRSFPNTTAGAEPVLEASRPVRTLGGAVRFDHGHRSAENCGTTDIHAM